MTAEQRSVVLYGAQHYCAASIRQLTASTRPTHVIPDGPNTVLGAGLIEVTIDELESLPAPIVLIARSPDQRGAIRQIARMLRERGMGYDHVSHHFHHAVLTAGLLSDLGFTTYRDVRANTINLGRQVADRIKISFLRNCSGCNITIGDSVYVRRLLAIDMFGNNASVSVGNNCSFIETEIEAGPDGNITIGEDCMFSFGIVLGQPDHHGIFDMATRERINHTKDIVIGSHVWIGRDARLLGGAQIGSGSVVGMASVTSSKFAENVVLAGSPARTLREGILWARDTIASQTLSSFEQCRDQAALIWLDDLCKLGDRHR